MRYARTYLEFLAAVGNPGEDGDLGAGERLAVREDHFAAWTAGKHLQVGDSITFKYSCDATLVRVGGESSAEGHWMYLVQVWPSSPVAFAPPPTAEQRALSCWSPAQVTDYLRERTHYDCDGWACQ